MANGRKVRWDGAMGDLTGLGEYKENRGGVGDGEGGVGAWFGHTPAGVPRTYDFAVTTGQLSGVSGVNYSSGQRGVRDYDFTEGWWC